MDSRNRGKCHHFPQSPSGRVRVLGNRAFPVYLVRGDRCSALVEAGISATADDVCRLLDRSGVTPDFIVITHPHGDHVAGLDAVRGKFPAIRVLAGEGTAAFLSRPRIAKSIVAEDRYMSSRLAARGYPAGRPPMSKVPSLDGAVICSDGEELDLGGVTLRFLAVGGHAAGNLAVFIPEVRTLLASDSLGFYYPGERFFPVFFTGYGEYMTTLDRLESLHPESLGLGHYGCMREAEVGETFALARRSASGLRERLKNDPWDEETAVSGIFGEFYRDELTLYSRENIIDCCRLLLRRSREEVGP
jgi:glyoxylase-like metal-dependent hydrolase (beta-lactamase superfamily II)